LSNEIATLYTHDDFDGLGSAAVFRHHFRVGEIRFSNPKRLEYEPVTERDGVLDLPFARRCAVWFDHHEQNFEDPAYQGIDPTTIPGLRLPAPSCARVILTWYEQQGLAVPDHFGPLVEEIDRFDTMNFSTLEEWLDESPGKMLVESLVMPNEMPRDRERYYLELIEALRFQPLSAVAADSRVQSRWLQRKKLNEDGRSILKKISRFLPGDDARRMVILDFTPLKFQPSADKKLILMDFPDVEYIASIYPHIERNVKTNTVTVSIGRNFLKHNGRPVDWGEFFAHRNIGGGHRDAAGARLEAASKPERDKKLDALLAAMLAAVNNPPPPPSAS